MAFLKKFDIKQICVVNHQDINILSNFGSRKTKNREMIGSSVKDFGSFYQKTLEPIFSKDRKTTALQVYICACLNSVLRCRTQRAKISSSINTETRYCCGMKYSTGLPPQIFDSGKTTTCAVAAPSPACHCVLFCKVQTRPRSCRSHLSWRPC